LTTELPTEIGTLVTKAGLLVKTTLVGVQPTSSSYGPKNLLELPTVLTLM